MLISCGTSTLRDKNWVCIEPSSEHNVEETLVRILRWAAEHIQKPWQVTFPVKTRGRKGVTMSAPYFLARTKDNTNWDKVKSVFGVQGVLKDANEKTLYVPNHYVEQLQKDTFDTMKKWHAGIHSGSFVRVLYGPYRMLCGEAVTRRKILLRNHRIQVHIQLASRKIRLIVPVSALQNLGDDVPKSLQKYYYTKKDL